MKLITWSLDSKDKEFDSTNRDFLQQSLTAPFEIECLELWNIKTPNSVTLLIQNSEEIFSIIPLHRHASKFINHGEIFILDTRDIELLKSNGKYLFKLQVNCNEDFKLKLYIMIKSNSRLNDPKYI